MQTFRFFCHLFLKRFITISLCFLTCMAVRAFARRESELLPEEERMWFYVTALKYLCERECVCVCVSGSVPLYMVCLSHVSNRTSSLRVSSIVQNKLIGNENLPPLLLSYIYTLSFLISCSSFSNAWVTFRSVHKFTVFEHRWNQNGLDLLS